MDNSIITSKKTAGVNVSDIEESNTDCQMETEPAHVAVEKCTSSVTVTLRTEETEGGEADLEDTRGGEGDQKDSEGGESDQEKEEEAKDDTVAVTGKRKTKATDETSPSKKAKTIDDLCVFVGNLNKSKDLEEVKSSLLSYFVTQGLLVEDIKMDLSGKYAFVNLASQMDFTKALTFNGEQLLDRPMRIAKATGRIREAAAAPVPADNKKTKDARCLFVKNLPIRSTKKDVQKIFEQAINIRFPGGSYNPNQGIAFLEFKTESIAHNVMEEKRGTKMQGRVLIVDYVGDKSSHKTSKTPVEASTGTTLFVSNLDYGVQEKTLKKIFGKAVSISIPKRTGKSRGIAYIDFETVEDAKEALESSHNQEIRKRSITVQFSDTKMKRADETFLKDTLIVKGLDKATSEETLKSAFEGALCARLVQDKGTGISKGFGFVDFATDEDCRAAKDVMQDCEIDGSKVTVEEAFSEKMFLNEAKGESRLS